MTTITDSGRAAKNCRNRPTRFLKWPASMHQRDVAMMQSFIDAMMQWCNDAMMLIPSESLLIRNLTITLACLSLWLPILTMFVFVFVFFFCFLIFWNVIEFGVPMGSRLKESPFLPTLGASWGENHQTAGRVEKSKWGNSGDRTCEKKKIWLKIHFFLFFYF